MKLDKLILKAIKLSTFACLVFFYSGCKEKRAFNEETAQSTVDLRSAVGEMDEVLKDINTILLEQYPLRGRSSSELTATTSVCGVVLDTLGQLQGKMTMHYNGTNCYGRTRTGDVTFSIEGYPLRKWKQKDCVINIEFINYQSVRSSDGKFVRLSGAQQLRNESGNSWFELWYMSSAPVTYVHTGQNLNITFTGDNTAVFSVNRKLTYSYGSDITACKVEGLGSSQGRGMVEAWGQSTSGENFAAEVTSPYTWKTTCGAMAPLSGAVSVVLEGKAFDLKCRYGVDQSGNQVAEGGACPFGWEVTWNRKKKTNSRLFGYY